MDSGGGVEAHPVTRPHRRRGRPAAGVYLPVPRTSGGLRTVTSPAPRAVWAAACQRDPFTLESQSPDWAAAMCAAHGLVDVSRAYEFDDGRVVILPLLRRRLLGGLLTVDRSNPPACGIGGLVAAGGVTAEEAATVLADLATRHPAVQAVSPGPLRLTAWPERAPAGGTVVEHRVHVLDLRPGWDAVWSGFAKTSRRLTRAATRNGVTIEHATGTRLLPEFYALVERSVARWARHQHEPLWLARHRLHHRDPLAKYDTIARHLGDRFTVWVARLDGRAVAASLVARGGNAHEFRAAMDDTAADAHATDLLQTAMIRDACQAGCRFYYLGESGWSTGLSTFKERFGAHPVIVPEYRFERLPVSAVERTAKRIVKRTIGFQD